MTDALDQEIEAKRKALVALDAERLKLDIELSALLRAAKLRPALGGAGKQTVSGSRAAELISTLERKGGKPAGAISPKWRDVLSDAYKIGGRHKYSEYFQYASEREIETNMTAIRDRIRAWERMGFLDGDPEIGFKVTELAAQRFGFERPKSASDLFGDGEAPASDSAEA